MSSSSPTALPTPPAGAHVLVVGAGGIGCELLKSLALSGFRHLDVVDLDTIEVSNLNRQFLFHREHVGRSKAEVACEATRRMLAWDTNNPSRITAHHGNIKHDQFGNSFFSQFDIVLNALDNVGARRHVNRLCMMAGKPLIESGTQGFLGQAMLIDHGQTECYDCRPHPTPKAFAACTIRNTPDKPVHCVVWAKSVFLALFGEPDPDNLMADQDDETANNDAAKPKSCPLSQLREPGKDMGNRIFQWYCVDEIKEQLKVKERWANRNPPTVPNLDTLLNQAARHDAPEEARSTTEPYGVDTDTLSPMVVWPASLYAVMLLRSCSRLVAERNVGSLAFDKDDPLIMQFVVALANLRMHNYGIELKSAFAVKGIAGKIIHAVGTTNAMCAALIVMQAMCVLEGRKGDCRGLWIGRAAPRLIRATALDPPNPSCYVCGGGGRRTLLVNTGKFTLRALYKSILMSEMGFNEPSIDVVTGDNALGVLEDHDDAYLSRTLGDPGIRVGDGALLKIEDESQDLSCTVCVVHRSDFSEGEAPVFMIEDAAATTKKSEKGRDASSSILSGTGPSVQPVAHAATGKGKGKGTVSSSAKLPRTAAYAMFLEDVRAGFKSKNPSLVGEEVEKALEGLWNKRSDAEHAKYVKQAEASKSKIAQMQAKSSTAKRRKK